MKVSAVLRSRGLTLAAEIESFIENSAPDLEKAADLMVETLKAGNTILTCGNGGSCAHAMHLEAELVGRYRSDRTPLPSIYLGGSQASVTAIANDYSPKLIFARPLEALSKKGDLLVAFSTSGTSANIIQALEAADKKQVNTLLISGPGAEDKATVVLRFPGDSADRIQDGHQLILHALMDAVEVLQN